MSIKKIEQASIVREGNQIILPKGMSYDLAMDNLRRQRDYEEQFIEIYEDVPSFVWDGALALQKAIKEIFGWSEATPQANMFGSSPPKMIQVEIGVGKTTLVPWGTFKLVGIEGDLATGSTLKKGRLIFQFRANVKRKHEGVIKQLAERAKWYVANESIYKGQAIKMQFCDENGRKLDMPQPTFIDAMSIVEEDIVFSKDVAKSIECNLLTPITHSDDCRKNRIPLKRGILLSGTYGTGKTLVANLTAKKCVENGWTFLMCERASEIRDMVDFAHQYQPAVVFCEDIDRVVEGDRDERIDDILNIIDGIESKKTELVVVLTTNQVEKIHPAMLRPGRLDAVINVLPPDSEAVGKLVRIYGRGLVPADEDLSRVGEVLSGKIPAVIRECVERAKLYAIQSSENGKLKIHSQDLVDSALSMTHQLSLLYGERKLTELERAGRVAKEFMESVLPKHLDGDFKDKFDTLCDNVRYVADNT